MRSQAELGTEGKYTEAHGAQEAEEHCPAQESTRGRHEPSVPNPGALVVA